MFFKAVFLLPRHCSVFKFTYLRHILVLRIQLLLLRMHILTLRIACLGPFIKLVSKSHVSNNIYLISFISSCSLCYNREMYKYMYIHVTDENQVGYLFFFNTRVKLISKGAKVTELLKYIPNFIVLCMFQNLPTVTYLSLRITVFCIFKR